MEVKVVRTEGGLFLSLSLLLLIHQTRVKYYKDEETWRKGGRPYGTIQLEQSVVRVRLFFCRCHIRLKTALYR